MIVKNSRNKKIKRLNELYRKPEFVRIFLIRFICCILIASFVFCGFVYLRRAYTREWVKDHYAADNTGLITRSTDVQSFLEFCTKNAFYSDDILKENFNIDNLDGNQRDKLYENLIRSYGENFLNNCYSSYMYYTYGPYDDDQDLFKTNYNSLILFRTSYNYDKNNSELVYGLAYELKDDSVSEGIKEVQRKLKSLNGFESYTRAYFTLDDVYYNNKDFTFVTDRITVQFYTYGEYDPKYDMFIDMELPSKEELEKQGYVHVHNSNDINDVSWNYVVPVLGNQNVDRSNFLTSFNYEAIKSAETTTLQDGNPFFEQSIKVFRKYNMLMMIPADEKSFWLRFYFPHPGEVFDRLHLYNQFEVTNHTILMIDGIIIYSLGIALSVILSLVTYNRKKVLYEISSYRRELTNIMAHDLKTPLMVLRGNAENLNDILSDEREIDREKGKKYASGFIRNVDYMNELVNKTLTLSSLESEADRLDKKQISIKALIEGAKEKCDDILSKRQIKVEFMGDDFTVLADEYLLGEAFRNLIDNASKYADENTSIQVFLEKRKIFISNMASDLTEKDLKKINDPFAKKDKSRGGRKGSGIGLSIVKNIVELHGWDFKTKLRDNIFIAEIKL